MKYLLVSDIHGSFDSTKIILEKFNKLNVDKIIILGDILYHGPRNDLPESYNPKKVIEILNSLSDNIISIKGNCDAEVDQMVLDFKLNDDFILKHNDLNIYLTHGHHINVNCPTSIDVDVVLYGHSHIYKINKVNDVIYINLGSITIPKQSTKRCYGILDDNELKIYDITDNLLIKYSF